MITEDDIRDITTTQSYSRGEEYYEAGMVRSLVRRGDVLHAEVSGSESRPYQVAILIDHDELVSASCTCPYDWGGHCKHIVAALLAVIREPEEVEERADLSVMLAEVDADTLRSLITQLPNQRPDLVSWLEAQLVLGRSKGAAPQGAGRPSRSADRKVAVDLKVIRRLVRTAMQSSGEYYATPDVVAGLNEALQLASRALQGGDAETALAIIEIIANATIPGWEQYDDSDGDFSSWFSLLGAVLTEALLTAQLTVEERDEWARRLKTWQAELAGYGVDEAFGAAMLAVRQAWDEPQLVQKLAGQFSYAGDEEEDGEYDEYEELYSDDLTAARLNVLERLGRIEEYLNLALAEGEAVRYATMLVKSARVQEGVAYSLQNLISCDEALAVAVALQEHREPAAALEVAAHGLGLACGYPASLAHWVREAASAQGDSALALRAALIAFESSVTLADYRAVRTLAGPEWSSLKPKLIAYLAACSNATHERTDIYLAEGMVDAAIQALDAQPYAHYSEVQKVAAAAVQSHPDWVIRRSRLMAESIMDAAQSTHYPTALYWLDIARRAFLAAGRPEEWRTYCQALLAKHARKYRLTPGLKELLAVQPCVSRNKTP